MKIIPIFFSFDDNYVPPAAVAFESLLSNAGQGVFYKMFVLYTKITNSNIEMLQQVIQKHNNAELTFIDVSSEFNFNFENKNFGKAPHKNMAFTVEILYCLCPMYIKEFEPYDKIIYSDVDIVVLEDISELYDLDLEDAYLAGVNAPEFLKYERTHLDSAMEGCYLAGGILVMNLKKMRESNVGEKIMEILQNPPFHLTWLDQDVNNLVYGRNVKFISYRYISVPDWLPMLLKRNFYDAYYPNDELYDAMFRPKIVHYAARKPWRDNATLKADLWYYWLSKTPAVDTVQPFCYPKEIYKYKVYLFGIPILTIKGEFVKNRMYRYLFNKIIFLKLRRYKLI